MSAGLPSARRLPWFSTVMAPHVRMTTCMWCSTSSTAVPVALIRPISSTSRPASLLFSPAAGSSSSSSFGLPAMARAISNRRWWP